MRLGLALLLLAVAVPDLVAQRAASRCNARDRYCNEIATIARNARVQRAFTYIERTDAAAIRELITLTQVAAPPFKEAERARRYAELLRAAGADSVFIDEAGNVIAVRRGTRRGRVVGLAGHLDTVFPEGTDVRVRQHGDTLFAPGVGDDTRGLIAMLQVLRSLVQSNIRTEADLWVIGTVGEEGLGDLRGVKHIFRAGAPRIDALIAVDGSSDEEITNAAVGSKRYRVTFNGEGGHSYGDFGAASPIHALGRAIHIFVEAARRFTTANPGTTFNVGRIGGGTSVNAIAFQAWMEVDMRSDARPPLDAIDSIFHVSMVRALNEQNERRTTGAELTLEARLVGDRPSGTTAAATPLVQRAIAATRFFGLTPQLDESSTDANVPISRGIPAITIGRGGISMNAHSPEEYWVNVQGTRGIRRILLIALAEAGLPR
jgi:acetylornithine deacetylase/succinyl-diaminopimelate desuccinylase-like protein